jgi:hypothetical protein
MKCPNCSAEAADVAADCPACGLVFAKWRERKEKEKREAATALAALEAPPPPSTPDLMLGRVVAGVIVVGWVLGLALYYRRSLSEGTRPVSRLSGERGSGLSGSDRGAR